MTKSLLEGKRGIISGALDERSIAWAVAEKAAEAGAQITLTNAPVALRMGKIEELAEKINAKVIPADATNIEDIENLYKGAMDNMGGKLDFVLHSIGMSPNVRKKKHYTDLNHDFFLKTLDISALSFHKMLQTAMKLDAINDWGSVVGLSYIAAQRAFPDYGDMAEAKAMLESIARSFGYHYGNKNKVRVNTISQSPTKTTAGTGVGGFDAFYEFTNQMAPLGNADANDCADLCVMLFSDLSKKLTMQNIYLDGGYSATGISTEVMQKFQS
jgi:enoyl-[acyl-carrier protein] reductase I